MRHVQEVYLWGKAELEDTLFQPKNDHLLFAYFGFSLTIRRRSLRTEVRSTLSMKRKAIACLGRMRSEEHKPVVIRDANGSSYPFKDNGKKRSSHEAFFLGHYYDGIVCKVKEFFAYLDADKKHWDYVESFNDVEFDRFVGRFYFGEEPEKRWKERERFAQFWSKIPDENRAMLEVRWYIPYRLIVAIDGDGDEYDEAAHIYLPFDLKNECSDAAEIKLNREIALTNPPFEDRIKFFPDSFPLAEEKPGDAPKFET